MLRWIAMGLTWVLWQEREVRKVTVANSSMVCGAMRLSQAVIKQ